MKKIILMAALLAGTAFSHNASAATMLTLTGITDSSVGPQSSSNPCIICATNAKQPADFGFNNFVASGNDSSYNLYSDANGVARGEGVQGTPYTVSQIITALGGNNAFDIAIDVNTTAAAAERLRSFDVLVNGVSQFTFNTPTTIGGIDNNGNGYADWILSRIDLSQFSMDSTVLFHALWDHASDGGESFFITNASLVQTPIPPALALFGMGLAGIGLLKRVTKKRNAPLGVA